MPIKYANNIQLITSTDNIYSWRSTGLSEEEIVNPYEPDTKFSPKLAGTIILKGICLKQKSVSFLYKDIVNLYISYKSDTWSKDLNTNFTLGNCLFGAVKLANLQHRVWFMFTIVVVRWKWWKNVIIFGTNNSSSVHVDGRKKYVLVLG